MIRVGIGFDVHAFDAARPLIIGGIEIPGSPGLAGHSDADVLSHAIGDALLGAAGLGDMGALFPNDARWKDASSLDMLGEIAQQLSSADWNIASIDATVIAEAPRLEGHRDGIVLSVGKALGVYSGEISVKATTTDGLGFTGRGEGIAAIAVAALYRDEPQPPR